MYEPRIRSHEGSFIYDVRTEGGGGTVNSGRSVDWGTGMVHAAVDVRSQF
jgi:hypothetical protein